MKSVFESLSFRSGRVWAIVLLLLGLLMSGGIAHADQLQVVVNGGGRVDSNPFATDITCDASGGPNCTFFTTADVTDTLTATPIAGFEFQGWGGDCAGFGTNSACTITVSGAPGIQTVSANFAPLPVAVDFDGDGVNSVDDLCPDTPPNTAVDADGCSQGQLDTDQDGVPNDVDQCPQTPVGTVVDATGCELMQQPSGGDEDEDNVGDDLDRCPATPVGEPVDAEGCAMSQLDDDDDGVSNDADQCPDTPPGTAVDTSGCTPAQLDDDDDGVSNVDDQCPNTAAGMVVDGEGCSEAQRFGTDLGTLVGLTPTQSALGSRIDTICAPLIAQDIAGNLNDGEQDLRDACARLKDADTTENQATDALARILPTQIVALQDYAVELSQIQYRHLRQRTRERKTGQADGVSVTGLNIEVDGELLPAQALQSAVDGLLGMGASEDSFADFGKLGLFIQGEFGSGDRDGDADVVGYDFDNWNMTIGGDYRFTDTFFAGVAISYGEVDFDYDDARGETNVDQWSLSLYSGWQITQEWYLDTMLAYNDSDFELDRQIVYTDVGGEFRSTQGADTDGDHLFFALNTGYNWQLGSWRIGPVVSLTYLDGEIDGYRESAEAGSDAWSFLVGAQDIESLRFSGGFQADYILSTSFGVLIPSVRASYVVETEDSDERIAVQLANDSFTNLSQSAQTITVNAQNADDTFIEAAFNLSAQFSYGISGYFSYNFYSAYDDFSKDSYAIGLRWDKSF